MATVVVFGGSGFLGRRIARRLAEEGATVRVAVRHPDRAAERLQAAELNRITILRADVLNAASVATAVAGTDAVVDAVAAYVEKGGATFEAVHERGAGTLAREARAARVTRFVLVSGLGADPGSTSPYIRSRGRGEDVVRQAFPEATIVRPSAMFGVGDAMFSTFAGLARVLPVLPLIGGETRLQPVYVEDVAEAIARIVSAPDTASLTYELAGPGTYTMRELVSYTLRWMDKRRPILPIPFAVARLQARVFELLPSPPLTTGQVDLLQIDNVASGALPGFSALGIQPRAVADIVPTYVGTARTPGPDD